MWACVINTINSFESVVHWLFDYACPTERGPYQARDRFVITQRRSRQYWQQQRPNPFNEWR
jgi:hypothetical protein